MKLWYLCLVLLVLVSCGTTEATRRNYSASGDPEDIFFERSPKKDPIARSVLDDLSTQKPAQETLTPPQKLPSVSQFDEVGLSSWYGQKFQGRPTASGEPFDRMKLTGAHRTLPIGSVVKIQNLENSKEAVVRINDRGPFVDDRIVDVSEKTAEILEFKDKGVTKVGIKVLKKGESQDLDDDDGDLLEDVPTKPEKISPKPPQGQPTKNNTNSSVAHASSPKGFTVQVGIFKEADRANRYKETLKAQSGEPVFVTSKDGMFAVQVGDFPERGKAESLKSRLRGDGIDCFITHR